MRNLCELHFYSKSFVLTWICKAAFSHSRSSILNFKCPGARKITLMIWEPPYRFEKLYNFWITWAAKLKPNRNHVYTTGCSLGFGTGEANGQLGTDGLLPMRNLCENDAKRMRKLIELRWPRAGRAALWDLVVGVISYKTSLEKINMMKNMTKQIFRIP